MPQTFKHSFFSIYCLFDCLFNNFIIIRLLFKFFDGNCDKLIYRLVFWESGTKKLINCIFNDFCFVLWYLLIWINWLTNFVIVFPSCFVNCAVCAFAYDIFDFINVNKTLLKLPNLNLSIIYLIKLIKNVINKNFLQLPLFTGVDKLLSKWLSNFLIHLLNYGYGFGLDVGVVMFEGFHDNDPLLWSFEYASIVLGDSHDCFDSLIQIVKISWS